MKLKKHNKAFIISILSFIILTFNLHKVYGQLFSGEQNPPSVKFNQINTPKFQIIYPTLLEQDAQRMANLLEKMINDVSKSLGRKPKPISIILQNRGVVSNGFVQMAPRRSEFYTIPSQEFDSQDWLNGLALHELRHVVQFDKLVPSLGAPIFEELKLALFGINLPPWFFEGDAVVTETVLSPGGRGRQPYFELTLRTNLGSNKHYSYSKNYLGSFKDIVPNYYTLGYFLTSKMRRDFGEKILDKTLSRMARFPIRPYNFTSSLKKHAGIGTSQLYKNTMQELDSLWAKQSDSSGKTLYQTAYHEEAQIPTFYQLPYLTAEGDLVCIKKSYAETPAITLIKNKKEETLLRIGFQLEPNLHYAANLLVWDEYRQDKRYGKQSFNVICIYNLKDKTFKQLTHKSRYFSPALSADGKKIIVVKVSYDNQFSLVELSAQNGEELKSYPNPEKYILQTPQYDDAGQKVVVTALNQDGKTLLVYDLGNSAIEKLFDPVRQLISRPTFAKQKILFKAHFNGTDNIYSFDLSTKDINRISDAQFGAYQPSYDVKNQKIYFSDYRNTGHRIVSIDLNSAKTTLRDKEPDNFLQYFKPLISQENTSNVFQDIPEKEYPIKPYKEAAHLFYFHSLRPTHTESEIDNQYVIGFDLASDNKLNTFSSTLGYTYNVGLRTSEYRAAVSFKKYYPIFTANYENRGRFSSVRLIRPNGETVVPFTWREHVSNFGITIPFATNWLNKGFSTGFNISSGYTSRYNLSLQPNNFPMQISFPMKYQFYMGLGTLRSERDLATPWLLNFNILYEHLPFDSNLDGSNLILKTFVNTPGLFSNHSLQLNFNWQSNSGVYRFNTDIARASGFLNLPALDRLHNSFLLDYRFPIAYPDWEVGPLAYIKRFKGGIFTDFENIGKGNGLRSYGAELRTDLNILRFYLPNVDFGTKIIMPAEESINKKPIFEFGLILNY